MAVDAMRPVGHDAPPPGLGRQAPLVSVITVVRNGRDTIGATIGSVLAQKTDEVEYIVLDGASTDGTRDVIAATTGIDIFISQADGGIYDAMNKGAALASGRFLLFINAGDRLTALPLEQLRTAPAGIDVMAFPVLIDGHRVFRPSHGPMLRLTNTLHHQGSFYRRTAVPPYDPNYRVYADYDLNLAMARAGRVRCHRDPIVAGHATDGVSNRRESGDEFFAIVRRWHGPAGVAASWLYFKLRGLLWRLRIQI